MYNDKRTRINTWIRSSQVRLIASNGDMVGIKPTYEALNMARSVGLDLVEISPTANPPVCKIMDFSKYLYEKEKQEKENRKKTEGQRFKGNKDKSQNSLQRP